MFIPHPALQPYVLNIHTIDASLPGHISEVTTPYPPSPFQSLMFYLDDPVSMGRAGEDHFVWQPLCLLTGPQLSRVNVRVHKKLRSIRVDFIPGAIHRILGIPMHELSDGGFDAGEFFGSAVKSLNEQLCEMTDLEQAKNVVEGFLLNHIKSSRELLPFDAAMFVLLQNFGNINIEKIAALSCLSLKQFERKCKERIGMNPKVYARILRFSKAYRLREAAPHMTWTAIAYEAGYFDQMHMIRDFKNFAGVNPSVMEQQLLSTPLRMQKDMQY